MKRNIKRMLPVFLALLLTLSCLVPFSLGAEDEQGTVRVKIEGIYSTVYDGIITYKNEPGDGPFTVKELMSFLNDNENLAIVGLESNYITSIAGESAGFFGGWDGWIFRINGVEGSESIETATVEDGDELLFYYSDEYGIGCQYPEINIDEIYETGKISFTSSDVDWSTGEPIVFENPVSGAFISFFNEANNGSDYIAAAITAEDGSVTLPKNVLHSGNLAFFIEKYSSNGVPVVIRRRFDISLIGPFDDVDLGAWYAPAVRWAKNAGVISGIGNNLFGVGRATSRSQFVTLLGNLAGINPKDYMDKECPFTDVKTSDWFSPYVVWAYENNITGGTSGTTFSPELPITRAEAATLIANYYAKNSRPSQEDAEVIIAKYTDSDTIPSWSAPSVAWATEKGVFSGSAVGEFMPRVLLSREQSAQVMMNLSPLTPDTTDSGNDNNIPSEILD